ncbi:MAG: NAD(P)-binding domain-containing protein [Prolixibacteraceae bacterium]|jgi:pyrroline-5-carboxylate reductase|nr:NAD(P)-binding domain-containing protein [Prolixibacteraceae bacterium]HNQ37040.1 NAD(P)-binding domain-containing protein [Prolixibacteraceae bacterium]HOY50490.1 NAD(P)-binding domain-containing protein [Prolixibacteraceae bacterium]HPJ77622.1 NAD(P)-binding domain-containing protein [Prolixibacteraceae bacterium]HRV88166.1 NAD(P)-binding domain-containing protein [Prolixibacteraceae bacterium]
MKTPTIGFIGGGRVTRILLQAFANKKINLLQASVYDTDPEVSRNLKKRFPDIHLRSLEKVAAQQIVILALHPQEIMETLEKIAPFVTSKTVMASLAPKINSTRIASGIPQVTKLVRMIPIAPSVINEGYNPIWFAPGFPSDEKEVVFQMLDFLGTTLEVDEKKLEAYAVISAMAPTYFWFQWKKLVDLGEEFGLDHQESKEAVLQCMYGSLETIFTSGIPLTEVLDLIPFKPIGAYEKEIEAIYEKQLKALYAKLTS